MSLSTAEILRAAAAAGRDVLGHILDKDVTDHLQRLLVALAARLEPACPDVHRVIVELASERVRALVRSPEVADKVLVDPTDPEHLYWLLLLPDHLIRRYANKLCRQDDAPFKMVAGGVLPAEFLADLLRGRRDPDDDE